MTEKKILRNEIKNLMRSSDPSYMEAADSRIAKHIFNSDMYREAQTIFTFVTMGMEINTLPIIQDALNKGKAVCAPKCYHNMMMEARRIMSIDDVVALNYEGLPEPKGYCPVVKKQKIDLIIVPCLTMDRRGYRLGYGAGYYDAYLRDFKGKALIICREKQISSRIPVESHDIPVGHYVTEKGIYKSST